MRSILSKLKQPVAATVLGFGLMFLGISTSQAQTTVPGKIPGQFAVSPSGAATYSIPIQVPPGIAGMQPKLSLEYNSQAGNGIMGMGWSLAGLSSITRCPATMAQDGIRGGVNYNSNDKFCLDGQRLIVTSGTYGAAGSEYRTEIESFSQITAYGTAGSSGPAYFIVKTKAGLTMLYGNTGDSVTITGTGTRISWGLTTITDIKGNDLKVTYWPDYGNGMTYPTQIDYAGNSITFNYGPEVRPDITTMYHAGTTHKNILTLKVISTFANKAPVQTTAVSYINESPLYRSQVSQLQTCNAGGQCLAPTKWTCPVSTNSLEILDLLGIVHQIDVGVVIV